MTKSPLSPGLRPFEDPNVARVFSDAPTDVRDGLLRLRDLIFEVAADAQDIGRIKETLKWGQPAYLTPETKSGSTIRLGLPKSGGFAICTHCQTTLISDFRTVFPDDFAYEGNRAIHFTSATALPLDKVALFVQSALTYHLKRSR